MITEHGIVVLPVQKLIDIHDEESDSSDSDEQSSSRLRSGSNQEIKRKKVWFRRIMGRHKSESSAPKFIDTSNGRQRRGSTRSLPTTNGEISNEAQNPDLLPAVPTRTLQRYHDGANAERSEFMEKNSALTKKRLAVAVEQVSIFLTADNCVVSFFEQSADDVEHPIISRLSSPDTVLRRSSDASMIVQALLDAIIDLAIPVTSAYQDAIDELELNVLTAPDIHSTSPLYILTSEISSFRANIAPIASLINALRDHKSEAVGGGPGYNGHVTKSSTTSVTITPITHTYLGDVDDHIALIMETIDQMRHAADNMIDLIFNTIGGLSGSTFV